MVTLYPFASTFPFNTPLSFLFDYIKTIDLLSEIRCSVLLKSCLITILSH